MSFSTFKLEPDITPDLPIKLPASSASFPGHHGIFSAFSDLVPTSSTLPQDSEVTRPEDLLGSFEYDALHRYPLEWENQNALEVWLRKEQESKTIELRVGGTRLNKSESKHWVKKYIYVCARNGTGGKKKYERKTERKRNIPSKRLEEGCPVKLTVKAYPGTAKLRGVYSGEHSHDVGNGNVRFTRISKEDKEEMVHLLRLGVDPKRV
ncbi:hypothetical protein V5O48_013969, partial [Marasmius crinis-equi]